MSDRPVNHEAVVDDLVEVWGSFAAACSDLATDAWDLPTDCPGWSVKDQLAHIIGVCLLYTSDAADE